MRSRHPELRNQLLGQIWLLPQCCGAPMGTQPLWTNLEDKNSILHNCDLIECWKLWVRCQHPLNQNVFILPPIGLISLLFLHSLSKVQGDSPTTISTNMVKM